MKKLRHTITSKIFDLYIRFSVNRMRMKKDSVKNDGGIVYYEGGCGVKSTIVLIHGFADSKSGHLMVAKQLLSQYRVLIPDLPGFGENAKNPHEQYSLSFMSDKVIELLREKNLGKVHLLGNSLGGAVAMDIAVKAPELVKSLVLVGSAGFYLPSVSSVQNEILEGNNIFHIHSDSEFKALTERVFSKPPKIPGFIFKYLSTNFQAEGLWYQKLVEDLVGESLIKDVDGKLLSESFNSKVKEFSMNTLLLWGDGDRIIPPEIGKFASTIVPNSELKILKNAGHAPQHENLADYMDSLLAFLNENESSEKRVGDI